MKQRAPPFYAGGSSHEWANLCLAEVTEGAELGDPCDIDPNDDIPGAVCRNEDYCFDGYCSIEYEGDADNPLPKVRECVGVVEEVIAAL